MLAQKKVHWQFHFLDLPEALYFSAVHKYFIKHLRVTDQESTDIKKRTIKQRECDAWIKHRKNRLGSSLCHNTCKETKFQYLCQGT